MTDTTAGTSPSVENAPVQAGSEERASRISIRSDFVWKLLAVLGVLLLVYIMIYLGTWLAMLN